MNYLLIAALKNVVAKKKLFEVYDNELRLALIEWVHSWKPAKLLKLFQSDPKVFDELPKGPNKPLYRQIALKPKQLDDLIAGKSFRCKREIESWSTSKDIRSDFATGDKNHHIVFKKNIPDKERLAYIPDLALDFKDSNFSNEGEVIALCQTVTEKDVFRILPATGHYNEEEFDKIKSKNYNKAFTLETFKKIRQKPLRLPEIKKLALDKFAKNQTKPEHMDEFEEHELSLPQGYYIRIQHPKKKKPWFTLQGPEFGEAYTYENRKWKKS